MTEIRYINLYEDNGGGLYLEDSNGTIYLNAEDSAGTFAEDAAAIIRDSAAWQGETTTDSTVLDHPETRHIATHNGERWAIQPHAKPGYSATRYMYGSR